MQTAYLDQERISVVRLPVAARPDVELEMGICERHI
jgi:hypothetical protein